MPSSYHSFFPELAVRASVVSITPFTIYEPCDLWKFMVIIETIDPSKESPCSWWNVGEEEVSEKIEPTAVDCSHEVILFFSLISGKKNETIIIISYIIIIIAIHG
jgi:hypothetical protein